METANLYYVLQNKGINGRYIKMCSLQQDINYSALNTTLKLGENITLEK